MQAKDTLFYKKMTINCNGKILKLDEPRIMAIINVTPDSFYKKSRYNKDDQIKARINQCIDEGADIIDIGGYSSRPGAENISTSDELKRLEPALKIIRKINNDLFISVDTFRSEVAKKVVQDYNVDFINDISGGELDKKMYEIILNYNIPYIIMHMQGNPQNMQNNPYYKDVVSEVMKFFVEKKEQLNNMGIKDLIIDPGFGFGKTIEHNYELLRNLENFKILNCPVLVGLSRKSMIFKLLRNSPDEALNATSALHMAALIKEVNILRVHDVKEAKEVIELYKAFN